MEKESTMMVNGGLEKKKRYYSIQLLRFIFCIMIVNYHFYTTFLRQEDLLPNLFCRGYIADEFFFMISGFFIAYSTINDKNSNDSTFTIKYIFRRIRRVAIPYYLSWALCFAGGRIKNYLDGESLNIIPNLLNSVYELLFLEMFGFVNGLYSNSVSWYFRALILIILIVCPLVGRYKKKYILNIAPVIGFFMLGILSIDYKFLYYPHQVMSEFPILKGTIRAFAEVNLGCFIYGLTMIISEEKISPRFVKMIKMIKWGLWIGIVLYMVYPFSTEQTRQYDYIFTILIFVALVITFVDDRLNPIKEGTLTRVFDTLGHFSLYVFFGQSIIYTVYYYYFSLELSLSIKTILFYVIIAFFSMLIYLVDCLCKKAKNTIA